MNIIEITDLSHTYQNECYGNTGDGLNNINLSIKKGEFVIIAGANGSGKTTLLRHLNGLLKPDSGTVTVANISTLKNPAKARQVVGMVFQDADSQIVGETVYDDIAFGPENLCLSPNMIKSRVNAALLETDLLNLADRRPHTLSGGEKRKLAIAGILAMKPEIIVLDEPFSNLDYRGTKIVLKQIISLHKSGNCTILLSTHDIEKVIFHATRLIIMEAGKIVKNGVPNKIIPHLEKYGIREPCYSHMGMETPSWLA